MQLQNKNRVSYLGALTLLFSYAEMILPRILPFFRLGFGNIVILLALDLSFPEFLILTIIKTVCSSMMNGTLISPFFLISISQSVISGLAMFGLFRIRKNWLSVYGISITGSAISAVIQILLSAIYLGNQTVRLLGPMMIFSAVSGIFTAFCSQALKIPQTAPELSLNAAAPENSGHGKVWNIIFCLLILAATAATFMINNLWILLAAFVISVILQIICGRRFMILPHLSIWIFVILVALFTPNGKVLFNIGSFSVTLGAVLEGIKKALKLSVAACLSQCAASLRPGTNSIFGITLTYYKALLDNFKAQKGNWLKRLQKTLSSKEL